MQILDPISKYFDILDLGWGPDIFVLLSFGGNVDKKLGWRAPEKNV